MLPPEQPEVLLNQPRSPDPRRQMLEEHCDQSAMQSLFHMALDAMLIADDEGRYLDANPAACRLLGLPKAEIIGRTIADFCLPEMAFEEVWQTFLQQGEMQGEFSLLRADGQQRDVEFSATANFLAHRHLSILRDVSDRKRAEAELQRLNQDLENRVAARTHELAQAQACLVAQQQRLDSILSSLNAVVWSVNPVTLEVIYLNPAVETLYGYSVDAFLADSGLWLSRVHPDDQPRLIAVWSQIVDLRQVSTEYRILRRDGEMRWVRDRASIVTDEAGNPLRIDGVTTDITDTKRYEQALQLSEACSRAVFHQAAIGINQADLEGRFIQVNAAFCRMLGYSEAELLNKRFQEVTHPDDVAETDDEMVRLYRGEIDSINLEKRYIRKDGTIVWGNTTLSILRDRTGQPISDIAVVQDISDRKATELALQQSERRHRALVNVLPDLIFRIDRQGTYLDCHAADPTLLYLAPEDFLGKTVRQVFPPERAEPFMARIDTALATQTLQQFEYTLAVQGVDRNFEGRMVPCETDQVILIVRDISDRKRAEQALVEERSLFIDGPTIVFKWAVAPDWPIDYVSPNVQPQLGYEPEVFLSRQLTYLDILHPEDRDLIRQEVNQHVAARDRYFSQEYRLRHANGDYRWFYDFTRVLYDRQGKVVQFLGYVQDISDRKAAELALQQSEATKRAMLEAIPDLLLRINRDGIRLDFISGGEVTLCPGVKPGDRQSIYNTLPKALADQRMHFIRQALETGDRQGYEHTIEVNGTLHHEETRIVPLNADEVLVMVRDVTDRVTAEAALRESEARWQFALSGSGDGVWDWNLETNHVFLSAQWKTMLGYGEHEVGDTFEAWQSVIHPDDKAQCIGDLDRHLRGETQIYQNEHRLRCKDGSYKWVLDRGKVLQRGPAGEPLRMIGTHTDVTERKQLELDLKTLAEQLQQAQRVAQLGNWWFDLNTQTLHWSEGLFRLFGMSPDQPPILLEDHPERVHPEDYDRWITYIHGDETGEAYRELDFRIIRMDGAVRYVNARTHVERDRTQPEGEREIVRIAGTLTDITERKLAEDRQAELYEKLQSANAELYHLAIVDGLTQIANRRYFDQVLTQEWVRAKRDRTPLALILCDIDFFKPYNDHYGHPAGDRCLQAVAHALQRVVGRPGDLVARYGGEEFAVLLPNTDEAGAIQIAECIQSEIAALALPHGFSEVNTSLTLSLGIACNNPHQPARTSDELVQWADAGLYQAKAQGRDRYCVGTANPLHSRSRVHPTTRNNGTPINAESAPDPPIPS